MRNGHDEVPYFTHAKHMPSDVFTYGREAPNCVDQRRYLATIVLATAEIEIIVSKDSRMRRKAATIECIELRNRLAHGNLGGIIGFEHNGPPEYSAEAREGALAQMKKGTAFVMEWYKTSPDVQKRQTVCHRRPEEASNS